VSVKGASDSANGGSAGGAAAADVDGDVREGKTIGAESTDCD
jgi:hypothetical protein